MISRTWAQVAHQFGDILWEVVGTAGALTAQGTGGQLIGAWRTPQAQVDTAWIEAGQGAELFGNHQWRVVWQHDATGTDADRRGASRQVTEQYRRGRTGNAVHVVVFGDPKAVIAESLDVTRKIEGVSQGLCRATVLAYWHQVECGNLDIGKSLHGLLGLLGSRLAGVERRPCWLCMGIFQRFNARL